MTDVESVDLALVVDLFLLLLIGVGPKIALVPFLELTAGMDEATRRRVVAKMLRTAAAVAVLLVVFGNLLTRLLHFSTGALAVASGIILLIISVPMVLGPRDPEAQSHTLEGKEPLELAVFPLAVPYLLNPAGIVVLVTASAEAASAAVLAVVLAVLVAVLALDFLVFRWANRISGQLKPNRMLVTEKIFGFLLAALAVQLALNGLAKVGVISLAGH